VSPPEPLEKKKAETPGTIINDVFIGHDSQLFLASGQHHSIEYATGRQPISPEAIRIFAANIRFRREHVQGRSSYPHVLFPDKRAALPEKYPVDLRVILGQT
jgi:hypothetical protein